MSASLGLHEDAQVAAIVWAKLLPSFAGTVMCDYSDEGRVSVRVMNRSLALIEHARDR